MTSIAQPAPPLAPDLLIGLIRDRADPRLIVLALSEERDMWFARIFARERAGFARGRAAGHAEGRAEAIREQAAADRYAADHVLTLASVPPIRELQIKRWAPPRWRGRLPEGLTTQQERLWLARLTWPGQYRGTR